MNDINQSQLSLFRGVHDTQPRPVTLDELVQTISDRQAESDQFSIDVPPDSGGCGSLFSA